MQRHFARATQQSVQQLDCTSVVAEDRINLRDLLRDLRTFECIFAFRSQIYRSLRFCDGSILFAEPREQFRQLNVQIRIVRFLLQLLFKNIFRFEERRARRCVIAQTLLSNAQRKYFSASEPGTAANDSSGTVAASCRTC